MNMMETVLGEVRKSRIHRERVFPIRLIAVTTMYMTEIVMLVLTSVSKARVALSRCVWLEFPVMISWKWPAVPCVDDTMQRIKMLTSASHGF